MEIKNTLPKYWFVRRDTCNADWHMVLAYLAKWGNFEIVQKDANYYDANYYGVDGSDNSMNGVSREMDLMDFKNNPVFLTIEDFKDLSKEYQVLPILPKDRLPKYWAVKENLSNPLMGKVYEYRNAREGGYRWPYVPDNNNEDVWYAKDGNIKMGSGFNLGLYYEFFLNEPLILTIEEFVELSKELIDVPAGI